MKGAVTVALVLLAGGLLAHLLLTDPGYVSVRIGRTLFETTVPVALLLLFGGLALLGLLLRAVTMRRRIARLGTERRQRHARRDAQLGIVELAAGNWKRAEDLLVRSAEESESPAANFLLAARAADLLDAPERRDQWLTRAQEY
ncbi:MAG TPA: heme biosynthesis HemY N-terminal domain-containing protein, partial [Steroidobacteraceae bacterium]|nr:heme biosynthesis HemY N-terminal domain-containing protein [Steroidobacteraceae bacterium]